MAANTYNLSTAQNTSSSRRPQEPPDEISLFRQEIILRSTSPSSSFTRHHTFPALSNLAPCQISAPDPNRALMNSYSGFGPPPNVSYSSLGRLDSEADEYNSESEEVGEAVVEETPAKATPRRSSSKRSRASEVHNQSEKRRRSRINEKMKALQNLIPNSNKSDKASMLDDAILYLKQLQLQVQTLTLRNGLSQYPICVPGIQPMYQKKMDPNFIFDSTHANQTGSVSMNHQNNPDPVIRLEDKCADNNQALVMGFSCTDASKSSFNVEPEPSTVLDHYSMHQRPRSSKKVRIRQLANEDFPQTSSTVLYAGAKATSPVLCETNTSSLNESTLEPYLAGVGGDHLLQNFVNHPIFSSHLNM